MKKIEEDEGEGMKKRMEQTGIVDDKLTEQIIGCAIEVHKQLGPGFLESIYQTAMMVEMRKRGLLPESEKEIKVYYDGAEIGTHRLDLVVNDEVIVELKAVLELNRSHRAQLVSYLKATGLKTGLLINFSGHTINVKRLVNQ